MISESLSIDLYSLKVLTSSCLLVCSIVAAQYLAWDMSNQQQVKAEWIWEWRRICFKSYQYHLRLMLWNTKEAFEQKIWDLETLVLKSQVQLTKDIHAIGRGWGTNQMVCVLELSFKGSTLDRILYQQLCEARRASRVSPEMASGLCFTRFIYSIGNVAYGALLGII